MLGVSRASGDTPDRVVGEFISLVCFHLLPCGSPGGFALPANYDTSSGRARPPAEPSSPRAPRLRVKSFFIVHPQREIAEASCFPASSEFVVKNDFSR
jgi:hypothetical protein